MPLQKTAVHALFALLCFVVAPPFARAAEAPDAEGPTNAEIERELVDDLDGALRAKDENGVEDHVERIADAFASITDEDVRAHLVKAVGKALRYKDDGVRKAALRAFATMKDDAAWKYVAPFLKQSDRKEKPEFFHEALQATVAMAPDAAVRVLLGHVQKSKHLGVATLSMNALGAFEGSKHRVRILETIIDTTRKEKPGVKGRENPNVYGPRYTGEAARNRWEALAGPMVEAANRLTGQEATSATEWFKLWSDHKREPRELFTQDA